MHDEDPPDPRDVNRRDPEGIHSDAWKGTLEDMETIADERREDGWEVVTALAAHTDTVSIDMGEDDEFGLVHILPNNHAEPFADLYDPDAFTEYLAYGTNVESFMYVVTELIDPDAERSILIASRYNVAFARGLVPSAEQEGYLPTRYKTIDGTVIGTFEHEEYGPLVDKPA